MQAGSTGIVATEDRQTDEKGRMNVVQVARCKIEKPMSSS